MSVGFLVTIRPDCWKFDYKIGHSIHHTYSGLQMVTKELYKPENGGRVGSRKVLIMLLCGDQTQVRVTKIPTSIIFLLLTIVCLPFWRSIFRPIIYAL